MKERKREEREWKNSKKLRSSPATKSLFRANGGIPFPSWTQRCFCSAPPLHFAAASSSALSSTYVWIHSYSHSHSHSHSHSSFSLICSALLYHSISSFLFFFFFSLSLLSISVSMFCWLCRPISQHQWLFGENIIGAKFSREMSAFCDYSNSSSSVLTGSDESSDTPPQEPLLFSTSPRLHELKLNVMLLILTSFFFFLYFCSSSMLFVWLGILGSVFVSAFSAVCDRFCALFCLKELLIWFGV